jgi:hypothetical protein
MRVEDRLTPLDAAFLHLEDEASHMHVGGVLVFDGEAPSYDDLVAHVESRLHLVPRYRQKLATVPLAQARPRWVDDPGFDVRFHVRDTALPSPGSAEQLRNIVGRVFSQRLDRSKPLWELWLVQGLERNRFAIINKTHHSLVDGVSGVDISTVLLEPEHERDGERRWRPRPEPSGLALLAEALVERATVPAELFRFARSFVRQPQRLAGAALKSIAGLAAMAWAERSPAPQTPYNPGSVGPDRRFAWALRRHLTRREEVVDELRAFVPVSVRSEGPRGQLGNQVAGMVVPLPVQCVDPEECFERIHAVTEGVKESGQALGTRALVELQGLAPPTLLSRAARLSARQRFVNLVVTNVPGPEGALFLGDSELLELFPLVPLGGNLNLGIAVVSYNGRFGFGLAGDFDAVPDLDDLAADFEAALEELAGAAGVSRPAGPARRPVRA